jgi:hypothetical protein
MALSGPAPKDVVRHRNRTHQFEEILNVPNDTMPKLPAYYRKRLGTNAMRWLLAAARSPQARSWSRADWGYCWDSALVAQAFYDNPARTANARELARRQADLGLTPSGRKSARIRYVDPPTEHQDNDEHIEDYS